MKQRYSGRVSGDKYEVLDPSGKVMMSVPLDEAKDDLKLQAAVKRNGWEAPE